MPRRVFLDTSGWIAVLNARDEWHAAAVARWKGFARQGCQLVLTDWILAETGNGLARTAARLNFARAARQVLASSHDRVLPVTSSPLTRALVLYSDRPDKTRGRVDCASFVVMTDQGLTEVFTTDRHFEQAGFTCLLPALPA